MPVTPRTIARKIKLSPPARVVRSTAESTADFARGYRYAQRIAAPQVPGRPAPRPDATALEEYFDAYGEGPGISKWRHYFSIYDRHLAKFRGRSPGVVEIGVFGGGSLLMWRDYFGAASSVYGVDIEPTCSKHATDGIRIEIGDQSDPAFWAEFVDRAGPLDVVIDDGGHEAFQQIPTLEALLPNLRAGGVYICEDIHDPLHAFHSYIDGLARPLHAIPAPGHSAPATGLHQHVTSVHRYPLVTVIEKPENQVIAFESVQRGTEWPP
jgi:hypothetical protein